MASRKVTMPDGRSYVIDNVGPNDSNEVIQARAEQQHRQTLSDEYGGKDPSMVTQWLRGGQHGLESMGAGLIAPFAQLANGKFSLEPTEPMKRRLEQGRAFVDNTGTASSVGQGIAEMIPYIGPGALTAAIRGTGSAVGLTPRVFSQSGPLANSLRNFAGMSAAGAATTPGDLGDRAWGAGIAATGEGVGQTLNGVLKKGFQMAQPFYQRGRERLLKNLLEGNSEHAPEELLNRLTPGHPSYGGREYVPGAAPTTAQAAMDGGLSRLADAAGSKYPAISDRLGAARENRLGAYSRVTSNLAGTDEGSMMRPYLENKRVQDGLRDYNLAFDPPGKPQATTNALGEEIYAVPTLQNTPQLQGWRDSLMERPSIQDAIPGAL